MTRLHSIQTGEASVKESFVTGSIAAGGLLPFFVGLHRKQPTVKLPMLAWVIEHDEGILIVDTGDWSETPPNFVTQVTNHIAPGEDFGPSLGRLGLPSDKPTTTYITHLHGDHANGLNTFATASAIISSDEQALVRTWLGKRIASMSCRIPATVEIRSLEFVRNDAIAFGKWAPLTKAGDVFAVPTPGHTRGHMSVIVVIEGLHYFLAGDLTYDEAAFKSGTIQGPSMAPKLHRESLRRGLEYARAHPTVYLPSHDPSSRARLKGLQTVQ